MPLLLIIVLLMLLVIVLIPVGIVRRYQVGTSRQRARGWLAAINVAGLAVSSTLLLISAALMTFWVDDALRYTAGGFIGGCALGVIGLWLTHWEQSDGALHYTPNRLLILTITLLVSARILYSFWRMWESSRRGFAGESWFVEAGVAGSLAAGALVVGYYFVFWIGVRRRTVRTGRMIRR
jgi:hypothetical protein